MRRFMLTAAAVGAAAVLAASARATPAYAAKEKKACGYCHVSSSGGGARNARGAYYAAHSHSFVGLPPAFTPLWKMEVAADTQRVAVADLGADKKPRLLTLGADNTLTVQNLTGDAPAREATISLGPRGSRFVAGQFAKGKPAVVAVPGAIFVKDGDAFARKDAPDINDITGTVRFSDGGLYAFWFDGTNMPAVWSVDPTAAKPISYGRDMVLPDQAQGIYREVVARLPSATIQQMGWPQELAKAGVLGLSDPRADGSLYAWAPLQAADGTYLVYLKLDAITMGDMKPVWRSEKLAGKVLDAVFAADPKGSEKTGLLILEAAGEDGKGRTLEFLALD